MGTVTRLHSGGTNPVTTSKIRLRRTNRTLPVRIEMSSPKKGRVNTDVIPRCMSFISVELSRRDQYTVKTIFRDAFLDSLNNPEMRIKILEKGATTINEAYTYCVRSEAYVASGKPEGDGGDADCRLRVVSQQNSRSDDQRFRFSVNWSPRSTAAAKN